MDSAKGWDGLGGAGLGGLAGLGWTGLDGTGRRGGTDGRMSRMRWMWVRLGCNLGIMDYLGHIRWNIVDFAVYVLLTFLQSSTSIALS